MSVPKKRLSVSRGKIRRWFGFYNLKLTEVKWDKKEMKWVPNYLRVSK